MNYLFYDVETSGLDNFTNDVITGCMVYTNFKHEVLEIYEFKSRPDYSWDDETEEIHGISHSDALGFPPRHDACRDILKFLDRNKIKSTNTTMVIQANPNRWFNRDTNKFSVPWFDWNFLFAMFWKEDMVWMLRKYLWFNPNETCKTLWTTLNRMGIKPRTLKSACEYIGYNLENHHDAVADTLALIECWKKLEGQGSHDREEHRESDTGLPLFESGSGVLES